MNHRSAYLILAYERHQLIKKNSAWHIAAKTEVAKLEIFCIQHRF